MLKAISWETILTILGGALLLYYLWWFWNYGRKNRHSQGKPPANIPKRRWRVEEPQEQPDRHATAAANESGLDEVGDGEGRESPDTEQEYERLQGLAADVTIVLQQSGQGSTRKQLLNGLRQEIRRYPTLQHKPAFRRAINRVMAEGAKTWCSMELTDEELNGLWDDAPTS
ncbi:hypothetical protein [Chitinophaga sp. XS-30]|uniref:hypothetical protein n=1 Tax=Chitinophaga sp. XS-30 TaxID=2604421 RepID=UPI0011DCC7E3|nr:hypothetical protein [Chitinophaga sp. XS-30]QEH39439.1 hypothetical protein FW415_00550 [Chitinophaga sp. XS-30]